MVYCESGREANPWALLTAFSMQASRRLLYELGSGVKSEQYMINILKDFYDETLKNPMFRKVYLSIEHDRGPSDKFARELLKSAEEGKWIKKSGDKYELGQVGIKLTQNKKILKHTENQ